jgi:alkylhydroperoxidase family enzyme
MRRDRVPDILRTMSHRPDFLAAIMDASRLHFSDGALTRAQHEIIASYVSALNRCPY